MLVHVISRDYNGLRQDAKRIPLPPWYVIVRRRHSTQFVLFQILKDSCYFIQRVLVMGKNEAFEI